MNRKVSSLENFIQLNTISDLLNNAVDKFTDDIAIRTKSKEKTVEKSFLQLHDDANAVSKYFRDLDMFQEKVAFIGNFSYEWIIAYLGVVVSGNIVVPIDKELSNLHIKKLLNQANVSICFLDDNLIELTQYIKEHCENIKIVIFSQPIEGFWKLSDLMQKERTSLSDEMNIKESLTAMIVFTSGTTGESKGVMLSQQNICHNVICSGSLLGLNTFVPGETTIPILPSHHMLGITAGILTPLLFWGMTICIGGGPKNFLKDVKEFKPALMIVVPMVVEGINNQIWRVAQRNDKSRKLKFAINLSNLLLKLKIDIIKILFREILDSLGGNLRVIVSGGSYMDSDLVDRFHDFNINLLNGYGITECSPVVSCNPINHIKRNSVGLVAPSPYCDLKIEGNEILIRGSIVMQGYYNDEANTKDAFKGEWFKTGDLGYLDEDSYLFITGRRKNLIILKDGNNISPEELEASIELHPLVDSVFVYAVENNKVDILTAAIHPNYIYALENGIDNPKLVLEEMISELNKSWTRCKRIQRIEIHEENFDRTALGKVKRFKYIK